jgi:hypothetical protein
MSESVGEQPESTQKQLSRSLGTIWANHTGGKPAAITTSFSGDVVRCEMEDADGVGPKTAGYRNDAMHAVARATGRKVKGIIPKHDKKTDVTTDTYILEERHIKR